MSLLRLPTVCAGNRQRDSSHSSREGLGHKSREVLHRITESKTTTQVSQTVGNLRVSLLVRQLMKEPSIVLREVNHVLI